MLHMDTTLLHWVLLAAGVAGALSLFWYLSDEDWL